jgi:hypothetical protein
MEHYPMTDEQRQCLDHNLTAIMGDLDDIANLLRACYGGGDMTVMRAEEASGAMQRLVWAVERRHTKGQPGAGQV